MHARSATFAATPFSLCPQSRTPSAHLWQLCVSTLAGMHVCVKRPGGNTRAARAQRQTCTPSPLDSFMWVYSGTSLVTWSLPMMPTRMPLLTPNAHKVCLCVCVPMRMLHLTTIAHKCVCVCYVPRLTPVEHNFVCVRVHAAPDTNCTQECVRACACVCMHVCVCVCVCAQAHACMCVCVQVHACVCGCVCFVQLFMVHLAQTACTPYEGQPWAYVGISPP